MLENKFPKTIPAGRWCGVDTVPVGEVRVWANKIIKDIQTVRCRDLKLTARTPARVYAEAAADALSKLGDVECELQKVVGG